MERLKSFDHFIGNDITVSEMKALIQNNKFPSFSAVAGPSGIGKTTLQFLLAKALNCLHRNGSDPCGTCKSCVQMDKYIDELSGGDGAIPGFYRIQVSKEAEIDPKNLADKILAATTLSYSDITVVLLDEAQNLRANVSDALLTHFELLPSSVKVILATTDLWKLEKAFLSRADITWNLHHPTNIEIVDLLTKVAKGRHKSVDFHILNLFAEKSRGNVRDAVKALEVFIDLEKEFTVNTVCIHLGILPVSYYREFFKATTLSRYMQIISLITANGFTLQDFVAQLEFVLNKSIMAHDGQLNSLDSSFADDYRTIFKNALPKMKNIYTILADSKLRDAHSRYMQIVFELLPISQVKETTIEAEKAIQLENASKLQSEKKGEFVLPPTFASLGAISAHMQSKALSEELKKKESEADLKITDALIK